MAHISEKRGKRLENNKRQVEIEFVVRMPEQVLRNLTAGYSKRHFIVEALLLKGGNERPLKPLNHRRAGPARHPQSTTASRRGTPLTSADEHLYEEL